MATRDEPNHADVEERPGLDDGALDVVAAAREKARVLYEGKQVPHHSCGIALATTFGLRAGPYQSLRRGGITGAGECGAIKAGELILGEYLGDPDPTGPVTPRLRAASEYYRDQWRQRAERGTGGAGGSIVCKDLVAPQGDFFGEQRQSFCTLLAASIAEIVAETLLRHGVELEITPLRVDAADREESQD